MDKGDRSPNMLIRTKRKIRVWSQSIKKQTRNLMRWGKYLKFKGSEKNFIKNGARVLEESISFFHGKANPIRQFSAKDLNNLNVERVPYYGGGFYTLHQGCWEGRVVTVKKARHNKNAESMFERESKFVREIVVATQMATHNNAHNLLGCCLETKYPVLVYEWVQAKTLEDRILLRDGNQSEQLLEWKDRLRIAWEISHAVAYLHTAFPRPIIHRDLKPLNVLLDQNSAARLWDFSFSISIEEGKKSVISNITGTVGYMDPKYSITGEVAESTDMYSFGMLLLRLLTGKRPCFCGNEQNDLVNWVQDGIKDNIATKIIDPAITRNGVTAIEDLQLRASIQLALFCITCEPDSRPTMVEVATALKSMIASPESIPTITKFQLPRKYSYNWRRNSEKIVNVEQEIEQEQAHTSINSANPVSFEDQVVDQVQCEEKKVKRTDKNEMMDKRMQTNKLVCLSSEPLQYLVGTEVFEYLPYSCKELHNLMACQPHETSIAVAFSADIFQYHDTQEEFEVYFTTHDVVQFLSMQWLNSSCLQLFMQYLDSKCRLLEVDSIAFMCPKRLAMVKKHLIFTSQYIQYAISELQSKSYVLAPYYQENHWTLIVVCPQRHVALFFDPTGKNLDGLAIKGRINMAFRSLQTEDAQEGLTWRLVQCPKQVNEAECGYYVMRYMYEIVTLYHQSHVNLEECFELESYTQQQINEVRDIWVRYFIDECT